MAANHFAFKVFVCVGILLLGPTILAQSSDPSVIASASGSGKSGHTWLQWTLGETAVHTIHTKDKMFTEGFHQSSVLVRSTPIDHLSQKIEVGIIPNPTSASIKITFRQLPEADIIMDLVDIKGSILIQHTLQSGNLFTEMDLQHLSPGIYFLKMRSNTNDLFPTTNIIKL